MSENRRVKLLHLLKTLDIGGVERTTINYSNEFVKEGLWTGIFAPRGLYSYTNIISKNVKIFSFDSKISSNILIQYRIFKSLKVLIKDENITIIHYHQRVFILLIILIKIFFKHILIVYTHHNIFNDFLNKIIIADKLSAPNKQTFNDLPKRLRKKATIIPHGMRIPDKRVNQKSEIRNIGYVGRFVKWKGIEDLIDAFAKIEKNNPAARLILQGDGPLKNKIKKIIEGHNLSDKVFVKSPVIALDEIYSEIDILVLSSEKLEGFGLVILEAMVRGIPAIVTSLDSFQELVINNYNGIITVNNLAEDIIRLLNNREKYRLLSENCITHASNRFRIDVTIKNYISKIYAVN